MELRPPSRSLPYMCKYNSQDVGRAVAVLGTVAVRALWPYALSLLVAYARASSRRLAPPV